MIEFIASNAYRRLNELSVGSVKINAAVCYWTMPPGELAPAFIAALRHKDSSLVVDMHSPTSIDSLAKLNLAGVHVFLYLFQIVGKTEVADSKGIPDHLMHAKIFVFDYGTPEIKIWVGSHNGTRRALLGLNFEFATVISCERNSDLHLKACASSMKSEIFLPSSSNLKSICTGRYKAAFRSMHSLSFRSLALRVLQTAP